MLRELFTSLRALLALTVLTGFLYPAVVTLAAQVLFPEEANGSLVRRGDQVVGSSLVGQPFSAPKYFWGRPSATSPAYNAASSTGSNFGPTNPKLLGDVKTRADALHASDPASKPENPRPIPIDMLTASGSGLDPHITPAAAYWQVPRIHLARPGISEERLRALIAERIEGGNLLGPERVNVLLLNLALDDLKGG